MSRTTVLAVYPGEKTLGIQELGNSWGSAPVVWDAITQRFLGGAPYTYMSLIDKLWPLWQDLNIPESLRAVLLMTFDRMLVLKKDYARAARDIRIFLNTFPPKDNSANHWNAIAAIFEGNPEYPAIGFWWTSVAEEPFVGSWNEETLENDPFDWSTAYNMYAELDSLKGSTR